jgi:hypothetical protein
VLDPYGIPLAFGTSLVADDRLHGEVNVQVVEAVAQAALEGAVRRRRNEARPRSLRTQPIDVFQDDRRLGHGAPRRLVAQHGEFAERPKAEEICSRCVVRQIDEVLLEGDLELI